MLLLNPRTVTFGQSTWDHITLLALDRRAERLVTDWSDNGPHMAFADVPEQRITIKLVQELMRDAIDAPTPGESDVLTFFTSPTAGDANRKRVEVTAVITNVTHELTLKKGALRTIELVAISADGAADPVTVSDA